MKVLILSCNTGQGHNSAAKAIMESVIESGGDCVIKDALSYASEKYSKRICESYNKIVLYTPKAFGAGYRLCKTIPSGGSIKSLAYISNMLCCKRLYDEIIAESFDAVICTHVFAGQAMTHIRHKYSLDIPVYIVSTDYSFCPFFNELDVDMYFIPMREILYEFTERRIPECKLLPTGIPVSKRFSAELDKISARKALSLDESRKLCLIMSGSMGYGDIYGLIDEIKNRALSGVSIIVIAGNNEKLKNGISEKYAQTSGISAIGFTDKVDLYMKACDVVVTKPGGLSSTEAMVSNIPLVLTKPIPGCETENFELLTGLGVAVGAKHPSEAADKIEALLLSENAREKMILMQKRYICRESAGNIVNWVMKGKLKKDEFVS